MELKELLTAKKIDESYESDIEYKEGVIELPEDCTYSVDGNRIFLDDQNMDRKVDQREQFWFCQIRHRINLSQ